MADKPISQMPAFVPLSRMIFPVVDPALGNGLKNGSISLLALAAYFGGVSSVGVANAIVTTDAAGNISAQQVMPTGGSVPITLAALAANDAAVTVTAAAAASAAAAAQTTANAAAAAAAALTGALHFTGTWNAATNTPVLASGVGVAGALYKVTVAGSTALDGISNWAVGDQAAFSGVTNTWNKIDGVSSEVLSVNGQAGAVVVQPQIAAGTGTQVLTAPSTLGGAPGTLNVGGANGLVQADASGNISALEVIPEGSSVPQPLSNLTVQGSVLVWSTPGTYSGTIPAGVVAIDLLLVSSGGPGGTGGIIPAGGSGSGGGGGGSGAIYQVRTIPVSMLPTLNYTVVVPSGTVAGGVASITFGTMVFRVSAGSAGTAGGNGIASNGGGGNYSAALNTLNLEWNTGSGCASNGYPANNGTGFEVASGGAAGGGLYGGAFVNGGYVIWYNNGVLVSSNPGAADGAAGASGVSNLEFPAMGPSGRYGMGGAGGAGSALGAGGVGGAGGSPGGGGGGGGSGKTAGGAGGPGGNGAVVMEMRT